MIEAFPEAKEADWRALEAILASLDFVAYVRPDTPGLDLDALYAMFRDWSPQIHKEFEIEPFCPCSEEGVLRALSSLGRDGLESLFLEGREAEMFCEFCRKRYTVSTEKILEMLNEAEDGADS
jgi:redox-regulated HSP33 family molecular chaperone